MSMSKRHRGFTLVELVIAIIIFAVAMAAFMLVVGDSIVRSADPMLRAQASSIGHAYLEEIMSKSYTPGPGTGARELYDDVQDYDGLVDNGARDINDNPIAGLEQYTVTVDVSNSSVNGQSMRRIQVDVASPNGDAVSMVGYRGNI
jgi:MSHA pilin protein MshD